MNPRGINLQEGLCYGLLVLLLSGCGKGVSSDVPTTNGVASVQWLTDYEVRSSDPEIKSLAVKITQGENDDQVKAMSIYNWVAANIQYDQDQWEQLNRDPSATQILGTYDESIATNVLHSKTALCQGFASLTSSLLAAVGIPSKIVSGSVTDSPHGCDHVWNKALIDGSWIVLDATWDAASTNKNKVWSDNYFDPNPSFFALSHTECAESAVVQ